MQIGLQTISWGSTIDDIRALCREAAEMGFAGIEIAQRVSSFREDDLTRFPAVLAEYGLKLAGLAGGSLTSRVAVHPLLRPEYYYLDEWDTDAIQAALTEYVDIQIGFHPHLYKDIDTIEASAAFMSRFPQVKLIPDTAHLTLVGEDIRNVLREHSHKVIAVHLKDWSSQYGASPFLFGQGFTVLGEGDLDNWSPSMLGRVLSTADEMRHHILTDVVNYLVRTNFDGWVIIEQDNVQGNPCHCARRSLDWLHATIREAEGSPDHFPG